MAGWIKLHRAFERHWLFDFNHPDKALAWLDMLMMANVKDHKFMIKGMLLECKRGQLAYSERSLAKKWKWSRNKLRAFIELLENEQMIERKTVPVTTIITICNYNKYQDMSTTESTSESTAERPVKVPHKGHNIRSKEVNNENKLLVISSNEDITCEKPKINGVPYKDIETLYHECLPMLPQIYKWTETRKRRVKALWHSELEEINHWRNYFNDIARSKFLTGRAQGKDGRTWKADFDFIINESNFIKIAEGKYSDQKI